MEKKTRKTVTEDWQMTDPDSPFGVYSFILKASLVFSVLFILIQPITLPGIVGGDSSESIFALSTGGQDSYETVAIDDFDFPEQKAKLTIRASQFEGKEHGFYFCENGSSGPVIEGDDSSIKDWQKVEISCDGGVGFFHVHPRFDDAYSDLSLGDKSVMYRDGFSIMCAGTLKGQVTCIKMTESGRESVEYNLVVNETFTGDPAVLNETEVGED